MLFSPRQALGRASSLWLLTCLLSALGWTVAVGLFSRNGAWDGALEIGWVMGMYGGLFSVPVIPVLVLLAGRTLRLGRFSRWPALSALLTGCWALALGIVAAVAFLNHFSPWQTLHVSLPFAWPFLITAHLAAALVYRPWLFPAKVARS